MTNLIAGNRIGVFNNEDGTTYDIDETITELDTLGQTFTYTNEAGDDFTIDMRNFETLTSIEIDSTAGTITYTDEDLVDHVLDVADLVKVHETVTTVVVDLGNQEFTYTDEDGGTTVVDIAALETNTSMTNLIAGNRIGVFNNEDGTTYDIDETITSLQDNGNSSFTYTPESGPAVTVFDNHLGRLDQTLTGLRTVDLVSYEMRFIGNSTTNARFSLLSSYALPCPCNVITMRRV